MLGSLISLAGADGRNDGYLIARVDDAFAFVVDIYILEVDSQSTSVQHLGLDSRISSL